MSTRTRWPQWISVAAALTLLLGAQGAAAQPMSSPNAGPLFPNSPAGFSVPVPPNCNSIIAFQINTTPQPIHDFGHPGSVVTSTIAFTQSLPYVWTVVAETAISHTYASDLDISLISPAGTKVTLSHRNGGGNNNVFAGTIWADLFTTPATDAVYQNNVVQHELIPEEAMGAFQGENGTGTWSLVVSDLEAVDTGTLNSWLMEVISLNEPPITATAHFGKVQDTVVANLGSVDSSLLVSGVAKTLVAAKLTTNISHLDPIQLVIKLSAPVALTTTISSNNGSNIANWFAGTQWYDQAGAAYPPGPVTMAEAMYPTSPLTAAVPEGAMGHFLAINPNGLWNLHVRDEAPAPGFTLNSWALDVTTGHCLAHEYLPIVKR